MTMDRALEKNLLFDLFLTTCGKVYIPVTKIIDVITREGKSSFRCYGSEAFVALIRKQLTGLSSIQRLT
jgi:hypothetical protein